MARRSRGILSGMFDLESEIQRIFREMFAPEPRAALASTQKWSPPTDVFHTPDEIVVRMELAGMKREEIDITYKDETVVVRGVRHDTFEGPKETFWQLEIAHGPFERVVKLPVQVDPDKYEARYEEGFLTIKFPVVRGETVKLIKIESDRVHDA